MRTKFAQSGIEADEESNQIKSSRTSCTEKKIKQGVQMIQYQVITLMTTNGQAPFVTVFMYLNEVPEGSGQEMILL